MSETPLIERLESPAAGRSRGIGFGSVSGDAYAPTITTAGSRATGKGDNSSAAVRGPVNRQYEQVFFDYYGRPVYWRLEQ